MATDLLSLTDFEAGWNTGALLLMSTTLMVMEALSGADDPSDTAAVMEYVLLDRL